MAGPATTRVLLPVVALASAGATAAWFVWGMDNGSPPAPVPSIAVHFADEASGGDFDHTAAVHRAGGGHDAATFAVEQLIAGPTADERARGLYSPLQGKLSGPSSCDGRDFSLSVESGRAELRFCRVVASGGIGDDGRIIAGLNATLRQFADVQRVVLLYSDGTCFGDESGENACLA